MEGPLLACRVGPRPGSRGDTETTGDRTMATGRGLQGVVASALAGVLLAGEGCAPRAVAPLAPAAAESYVIVRNLTGDPARVFLDGGNYGELLGVVPPLGMARFR